MKLVVIVMVLVLALFVSPVFAQDSNPDGAIGKLVLGLYGGVRTGTGESITSQGNLSVRHNSDFSGSGLWAVITYPASRSISLIFQVSGDWQNTEFPETSDFYKQESKYGIYSFAFGIRIFGQ